jgi:hypothetical protein
LLPTWYYFLWNLRSQSPGVHDQGEASPTGQTDAAASSKMVHDFGDGPDVAAAQDGIGLVDGAEFGGDGVGLDSSAA